MGIQLYDSLIASRHLVHRDGMLTLSSKGNSYIKEVGIELDKLQAARSPVCRECLDWSERRSHLAGSLGRALLGRFEKLRWVSRAEDSRIVRFSTRGRQAFDATFASIKR